MHIGEGYEQDFYYDEYAENGQAPVSTLKICNKSKWLTQINHVAMKITKRKEKGLFPKYPI